MEKFDERRVNLLKSQVIQLERQVRDFIKGTSGTLKFLKSYIKYGVILPCNLESFTS